MSTWLFIIALTLPTNPWSVSDWQPLKDRYAVCQAESLSALEYYECADRAHQSATHPTYYA